MDFIVFVNDKQIGRGRIENTEPFVFSGDETVDVGEDNCDYGPIPAGRDTTGKRTQGIKEKVCRGEGKDKPKSLEGLIKMTS